MDASANILKLASAPPLRASIARLAANYPAQLAQAIGGAQVTDGTIGENGQRQCRAMSSRESAASAVNLAGLVFSSFFYHRVRMEHAAGLAGIGLHDFFTGAVDRLSTRFDQAFDGPAAVVADPETAIPLNAFHQALVQHVFGAFRLEMNAPDTDEPMFWQRVFLGLSDVPDPSGVVATAARLVFLDYQPAFKTALEADMAHSAVAGTRH